MRKAGGDRHLVDRLVTEVDRASPELAKALRQLDRLATVDHLRAMEALLDTEPCSVAIAGPVNVGKSTLANALAGRKVARVGATPGTTTTPERHDAMGFELVDTPGADEVAGGDRRDAALAEVAEAGVVLLVLDASRGVALSERSVFEAVVVALDEASGEGASGAVAAIEAGRLVVCINKIDLVARREREDVRRRAARDLGLAADHVIGISALKRRGLDALARRMVAAAPSMAEALAEAMPAYVDDLAAGLIHRYGAVAATVALTPVPGPDVLPLTAIQALMVVRLARLYGREMSWKRSGEILPAVAAGLGWREMFRQAAKLVPGPGWALSSGIAYAGTYATGRGAQQMLKTGKWPSVRQLAAWRREARKRRRSRLFDNKDRD